jgi:AcrR family transcriptional regulator
MTKLNVTAGERHYHHGDLHRAIVSAALKVLSESQSTEFSLRGLARRAGVSHSAPYKHFTDKRELLEHFTIRLTISGADEIGRTLLC